MIGNNIKIKGGVSILPLVGTLIICLSICIFSIVLFISAHNLKYISNLNKEIDAEYKQLLKLNKKDDSILKEIHTKEACEIFVKNQKKIWSKIELDGEIINDNQEIYEKCFVKKDKVEVKLSGHIENQKAS